MKFDWSRLCHILLLSAAFAVFFWGLLSVGGCQVSQATTPTPSSANVIKYITKTNWQQTLCWLSVMGGLFAFFNGNSSGIKFIAVGLIGMAIWYMQLVYVQWMAFIGLLGSLALVGYTIYGRIMERRALSETIIGIQNLKQSIEGTAVQKKGGVSQVMQQAQSKTSQQVVKEIKNALYKSK